MRELQWSKKYFAEYIGTFALVFAGTGAIIINDLNRGIISHLGIGLTFGLIVMAMIYTLGDVSGAHLNPAVSLGFWVAHRFPKSRILPYIFSQCTGALSASALLRFLFPQHPTLGTTIPAVSNSQAFILEIVLTFFLMFVIINVATGAKEKGLMAGVAIGSIVALEAIFAGPATGASLNPARSLGPALVSGQLHTLWIYITAPMLGAYLAVPCCKCVQEEGCCTVKEQTA